ncbi:YrhB domain-containing protein [Actinophytocola oryzae]|uniref:YrhB domain-containing protein n=1 Tax=Actinophytocola oryzae TaxID=502181 RepID=UPI001FBAB263|nr:YrhB domain-containing protein [Actinophytocola oryzae]
MPLRLAAGWLDHSYGGLVTVDGGQPLLETELSWLVPCAYADHPGPLLAATLAVPKDGTEPFPVGNSDPLAPETADGWQWRVNARGCLVATDAAVDDRPASALPWRPADEAPGWWDRLLTRHFPAAEVATCATWDDVTSAIVAGGPGTRGAVWLRRRVAGAELTGHLLYAYHADGKAVVVDGQRGEPAWLDDEEVGGLVLARFHRADPTGPLMPSLAAAPDLAAAVDKATSWLAGAYDGAVTLVDPAAGDETARGWLFACATRRFQVTGDWRDQLLDAALVVPKAAGTEPFGLPNDDPWTWLSAWDAGRDDLPEPPEPGAASWFGPTAGQLGTVRATSTHQNWGDALLALSDLPNGAKALVWLRRRDGRGRETVGNVLVAVKDGDEVRLVDSRTSEPAIEPNPLAVHVVSFG